MIVTLITQKNINTITLPEKVRGQFWLNDSSSGTSSRLIGIEAVDGEWVLKSNRRVGILNVVNNDLYSTDGKQVVGKDVVKNIVLKPSGVYNLFIADIDGEALIYTETNTDDRQAYKKYAIDDAAEICIGRNENNDIVIDNEYTSGSHAKLIYKSKKWNINDRDYERDSTNGTFVNGDRITNRTLNIGDVVYIMGFKLIMGRNFIAINNPDGSVKVKTDKLHPLTLQETLSFEEDDDEDAENESTSDYFYRSPRFRRDVEKVKIKVDSPPQSGIGEEMPMIMVLGPSMTMGMASMATAIFTINNAIANGNVSAATPSIVMSASMLLGSIMWPVLSKRFDKRVKLVKEGLRQKKYREYLTRLSVIIGKESEKQKEILRENYVTIDDCVSRIQNTKRNLWERSFGQADFLELRVGTGSRQLSADISYTERVFTIEEDELNEELFALCENPKQLSKVPITLSLYNNHISGVIGDSNRTGEFAKGILFQLASLYSYDEVKMVFLLGRSKEKEFEFTKWLPHVWSNDDTFRFLASDSNEAKEVSAYIEHEFENRLDLKKEGIEAAAPYYVIFVMDRDMGDKVEALKNIQAEKRNLHFSIVYFYEELQNLPKECSIVVDLDASGGKLFDRNDVSGKITSFIPDIFLQSNPDKLSIKLSNVQLDTLAGAFKLPQMLTFLEMFGVGKVEHLNALSRWRENNPVKSLKAAVGVDTTGDLFQLDLHEKFHGPHGLVAGMTGSGKSEFIITYILSLAVNYHPNEVAFILIDYKGGGMAKSFENLPHTAGIITNLDGGAIKRSLISIESELKRRQAIFVEAGKKIGVSNIDIYKYQRLYREGSVNEPLQHLFIISDEFAELKTQQPEFMTKLVSAARIGRSLGIHLILATQKPAGVVDDQIWSNSRFRVCLKVQERADSMDMLKRPDAAELSDTGRFYLQVGYNELFETGQSAWAGAPYHASDKVIKEKDNSVVFIDLNGRPIREVKPVTKKDLDDNPPKQLDVITEYLGSIAAEENIKIRPLWLPPMPEMMLVDALRTKYNIQTSGFELNPVIGEYDDPARQRQDVLRLPLSREGNALVYGMAGGGKTTFLTSTIYSLMREHTPEEVNIYILDFASETLRSFAKAPHVGDVVLSFEAEKITNLFMMLLNEIEKRKKLFTDYGGDHKSYIEATGEKKASIVVMINNYAAFSEIYMEMEDTISYVTREGTKYGIYFIITTTGVNSVRFKLQQNFNQLFALQLTTDSDYMTLLGKTEGLLPSKIKGRGLIKTDDVYEFQTAHIVSDIVQFGHVREICEKCRTTWKGQPAPPIPMLPDNVNVEYLSNYIQDRAGLNVPIGIENKTLAIHYYDFSNAFAHLILSNNDEYLPFAGALSKLMITEYDSDVIIIDSQRRFSEQLGEKSGYYVSTDKIEEAVDDLFDVICARAATYKQAIANGKAAEAFKPKVVIINSLSSLKSIVSSKCNERLSLLLETGETYYNIIVVIAEAAKNLTNYSYDTWYKKHITQNDGIWVGDGFTAQYHIKPGTITKEMREETEDGFGFSLIKGKAVKIKALSET